MTGAEMWAEFAAKNNLSDTDWDAWAFGDDTDGLAQLTLEGVKTATSSAFPFYGLEGEPLPEAGEYSVILDSQEEAVCIIRTERVAIVPFRDVGADHARREGEGDLSLAYWRNAHEAFFAKELRAARLVFDGDLPVVCEEFRKVWPDKGELYD